VIPASLKLSGFILIIIGTAGLLIAEFAFHGGSVGSPNLTLIFAAVNVVGLALLAIAHRGAKRGR